MTPNPEPDIIALYNMTNPHIQPHRLQTFIKKFRKIEAFIREWDLNHKEDTE